MALFNHWSETKYIKDIITNPLIEVGDYSYYSGYYTNQNFENGCVRYMWGDDESRQLFNPMTDMGWHVENISVYPFPETIQATYQPKGDTLIKSDAWLGMKAMIMPGVTIGEGAIVAAGSVVTKDVPPYTMVGGNPAKEIKKRFSEEDIKTLQTIKWYDWPRAKVLQALPLITKGSVSDLADFYEKEVRNDM